MYVRICYVATYEYEYDYEYRSVSIHNVISIHCVIL